MSRRTPSRKPSSASRQSAPTEPMEPAEPVALDILRIAVGGDAIATLPDGRIAFVDRGFPGDRVEARVTESRKRYARATALAITPAAEVHLPLCPHAGECGGCRFQGADPAQELRWKADALLGTLRRLAPGLDWPEPALHASASPTGWRHRVRLQVDTEGRSGFHRRGSTTLVPASSCNVLHPALDAMRLALRPVLRAHTPLTHLFLEWDPVREGVAALLQCAPAAASSSASTPLPEGLTTLVIATGDERTILHGDGCVHRTLATPEGERLLREPVGSFSQAHHELNRTLRTLVRDWALADRPAPPPILELFAGAANLSAPLLSAGASVSAVEGAPAPLQAAAQALGGCAFRPFVHDLQHGLPADLQGLDDPALVVVADPPRTGLSAPLLQQLAATSAERLVYVSCDPPHLARDAKRLSAAGFSVTQLAFLDMFPRTAHLEAVACLERPLSRRRDPGARGPGSP